MSSLKNKVILHLTSLSSGGGGSITMDIHHTCLQYGYDSYVVVRGKKCIFPDGTTKEIKATRLFWWNKLRRFLFRQVVKCSSIDDMYAMYNLCERYTCYSAKDILSCLPMKPDVVFVHWVSDFANAKIIWDLERMTGAKIVFLLVDYALYSGGCHYQLDCQGYRNGCHRCPATSSAWVRLGIEQNYAFKRRYIPKDCIIVASGVEVERLKQSDIYKDCRTETVVFPLDEDKFCPSNDKTVLREKWNLDAGKKIVLVGATHLNEPRKGMKLLIDALKKVKSDVQVLMVGKVDESLQLPENVVLTGLLTESQLIEAYQMADVFACPSLADAGPLMVKQAIMCGTPTVAFPVGVSVELVETKVTGYLAQYGNTEDLAHGIDEIVSLSNDRWNEMSRLCRNRGIRLFSRHSGNTIDDLIGKLSI